MLKKESPQSAYKNTNLNYLSHAVTVKGTYTSDADAIIAGRIEGDVYVKGKLKLENPGVVTGKIVANEIDIYGRVEGELRCEGKVILRNSAVINADLYARTLQVEAEASISGELIVSERGNKSGLKRVSQK